MIDENTFSLTNLLVNGNVTTAIRLGNSPVQVWRTEDRQVNVAVYEQAEVQCGILASRFSA
jgi:hypothetical protein